jgi:exocyst complex component 8
MDDKGKGVSLRQKRTGKLKISAPTLISAPASATASTVDLPSRPSTRGTSNSPTPSVVTPRPRDKSREDRTTDLVKRRYSTRFNNLPDLSGDPDAVPTLPAIPSRFAVQPPSRGSDVSTGRTPKVDPKILKDPKFKAEDCMYVTASTAIF